MMTERTTSSLKRGSWCGLKSAFVSVFAGLQLESVPMISSLRCGKRWDHFTGEQQTMASLQRKTHSRCLDQRQQPHVLIPTHPQTTCSVKVVSAMRETSVFKKRETRLSPHKESLHKKQEIYFFLALFTEFSLFSFKLLTYCSYLSLTQWNVNQFLYKNV